MILIVLPDLAVEDQLLARARRQDDDALREIFNLYFQPVYQFIRMRVEDSAQAEDLASDVFVKLLDSLRRGGGPRQTLRGWLFQVARRELYDHYGRQKRITVTAIDEFMPAPEEERPDIQFMNTLDSVNARRALRLLTDEQQEVLLLRFGQMLSLQETAAIMGKNANAIKALQFRAVNALRRILGDLQGEASHG